MKEIGEVKFCEEAKDDKLRFAVIISRFQGKWVFCNHKERDTYDVPGDIGNRGRKYSECSIMLKFIPLKRNCIVK